MTRLHTHEEVICRWTGPSMPKELHKIPELTVNVPTDGDGCINMLNIGLFDKNLTRFQAQILDLRLGYRLTALELRDLPLKDR